MSSANEVRDELRYTRDHEWAKQDGPEIVVGITPFAVEQLGDITMVNFDVQAGDEIEAGKPFGTVESVKTVSDLYAPVSGKISRINADLDSRPELLNEDCWNRGWLVALVPSDPSTLQSELLDAAGYRSHLDGASE